MKTEEGVKNRMFLNLKMAKVFEKYQPGDDGKLLKSLAPYFGYFVFDAAEILQVGIEPIIKLASDAGVKIFLDGKYMGCPDTIARIAAIMQKYGVDAFSLHAASYTKALEEAKKIQITPKEKSNSIEPQVFVETATGSPRLDYSDSESPLKERLCRFAQVAKNAEADGLMVPAEYSSIFRDRANVLKNMVRLATGVTTSWSIPEAEEKRGGIRSPKNTDVRRCLDAGASAIMIGDDVLFPPADIGTPAQAAAIIYKIVADFHEKCFLDKV
jgi:orotidine-5'-phosphate decarboxylase